MNTLRSAALGLLVLLTALPYPGTAEIPEAIRGDPQKLKDYFDNFPKTGNPIDYFLDRDTLTPEEEEGIEALERAESDAQWNESSAFDGPVTAGEWVDNTSMMVTSVHTGTAEVQLDGATADRIEGARQQHGTQIHQLQADLERVHADLATALREREIATANLQSTKAGDAWWESVAAGLGLDQRINYLEKLVRDADERILVLRGIAAAIGDALRDKIAEAERYENRLATEAVKSDPGLLCSETDRRFTEAVELSRDLATARRQLAAGDSEFRLQLQTLDQAIAGARANGLDLVAEQLIADKAETEATYDLWLHGQQVNLQGKADALNSALSRNAADGIGATTPNELMAEVVERGLDIGAVLESADQERIDSSRLSARAAAQGSHATQEVYDWRDFAHDYASEFRVTFGSWDGFSSRYGAYLRGVGNASVDAAKDLLILGRESLRTGAQATEVALGHYSGIETDVFGRGNLEFIAGLEYNPLAVGEALSGVGTWASRRIEMQAGSGNVEQTLEDVGYVVGTVAAPEEALARTLAQTGKAIRLIRAERLASASADTARAAGTAADAGRAGGAAADAGRASDALDPLDDAGAASRLGDAELPDAGPGAARTGSPEPGATGRAEGTPPPSRAPPMDSRGMTVAIDAKTNTATLTRADGSQLILEKRLGGGSFSEVYAVPGRDDIVIKITKPAYGAEQLDRFGYEALRGVDSDAVEVTEIFNQYRITNAGPHQGGLVSIVQTAPTAFGKAEDIGVALPNGRFDMTPGQARAFDDATRALADAGHVWVDNHPGNFALKRIGDGDQWRVVFFDFGGVVPAVSVEAAHELRRMLLAPTDEFLLSVANNPRLIQETWLPKLAEQGDALVDWQRFQDATGTGYRSLGEGFGARDEAGRLLKHPEHVLPSLPWTGVKYPALRAAVSDAGAVVPPANPLSIGPGLVDRSATTIPTMTPASIPAIDRAARTLPDTLGGSSCRAGRGVAAYDGLLGVLNAPMDPALGPYVLRRLWVAGCLPEEADCTGSRQFLLLKPDTPEAVLANFVASANPERTKQIDPNDPLFMSKGSWGQREDDQWALKRIGIDPAFLGGLPRLQPITVAIIDSGLAWGHADFDPHRLWVNHREVPGNAVDDDDNGYVDDIVGWNFVEQNNLPWDLDGHGTLVASLVGATTGNGIGIAGASPNARIMVLRALDASGLSRASVLIEAIGYAVNHGARIINISAGGRELTPVEHEAIRMARGKGVLVVVAAGNEASDLAQWGPGGAPGAITVGATDFGDNHAPWSNHGLSVSLAAPGTDVLGLRAIGTDLMANMGLSDYQQGANFVGRDRAYFRSSGTSFAAPLITAAAALVWGSHPDLAVDEVERLVVQSARDVDYPGIDRMTGYGRVDLKAALQGDPAVYVQARIDGVTVVQEPNRVMIQVKGSAAANELDRATLGIGTGELPVSWEPAGESIRSNVVDGLLGSIDAMRLGGSPQWTIRLVVRNRNGQERENRFVLNLN